MMVTQCFAIYSTMCHFLVAFSDPITVDSAPDGLSVGNEQVCFLEGWHETGLLTLILYRITFSQCQVRVYQITVCCCYRASS